MRRALEIGGLVAGAVLIAFGVAALIMGINGRDTVISSIKQEKIVGSPDMTPKGIAAEVKGNPALANVKLPTCSVASLDVNSGDRARCFAQYMRIHTLEATTGLTYSQMGRYKAQPAAPKSATDGLGGTNDAKWAVTDPVTTQPVDNARRSIWVTETALTTALNSSYMADQISLFGVVVGVALLLSGLGFGILALGGALRRVLPAPATATMKQPISVTANPAGV